MDESRDSVQGIIQLVLKAVALGMSVASVVLGFLGAADADTQVTLLSLGLFALSVAMLQKNA
jgi:threonine/homoserine efflux transporter RhtA